MTGNMIKGKGFRGALRYNMEKVAKNVAEVLDHSFVEVSEKSILKEVAMVKILRPNLEKYFYHTSINFPPSENLTNPTMAQIGRDYLSESGFDQHQFIMFRHHDADHPHLHILVNRIGYDGKVSSDSNDFAKAEKIFRKLEKKYHLTEVLSSNQARERAMTKDELEMMKRTNQPSHKMALQIILKDVLSTKSRLTSSEFIQALEEKKINVLFNQASTGYVSGISYSYEGMIVTGAKLGNDFKWTTLKNKIDYEQERDRATIHQANARTKSLDTFSKRADGHHSGDTKVISQDGANVNSASKSAQADQLFNSESAKQSERSSKPKRAIQPAVQKHKRSNGNHSSTIPEKSNSLNLASLLDGISNGNNSHVDHQPDLGAEHMIRRKRKKKRGRRL